MPGIELLRGLAALVVVFHHLWSLSAQPRFRFDWLIEGFGSFGVNIFFVLSAFLLCPPCWTMSSGSDLRTFWWRRGARIMPAYYANIFILFLFFIPAGALFTMAGLKQVLANLTFTNHFFITTESSFGANGVLWTLSVEFVLYLLLPPIGWLFARAPLLVFAAMVAIGVGWRIWIGVSGDGLRDLYFGDAAVPIEIQSLFIARQFIGYLPLFAIGIGARWFHDRHRETLRARLPSIGLFGTIALLIPGALYLQFVVRSSFYTRWVWFSTFDTIVALLIVPALLFAACGSVSDNAVNRASEWLGQRSYGLYLWHFPVILVAYERGIQYAPPMSSFIGLRILFVFVVASVLAEVSYRAIEMPVQRWARARQADR